MALSEQKGGRYGKGCPVVRMPVVFFEFVDAVDPLGGFQIGQKDGHCTGLLDPELVSRPHHGVLAQCVLDVLGFH